MAPVDVAQERPRVEICSPDPYGYFSFVFRMPAAGEGFLGADFEIADPTEITADAWRRLAAGEETTAAPGYLGNRLGGVRCRGGVLEFVAKPNYADGEPRCSWRASVEYFRDALLVVVDEAVQLGLIQ